MPLYTVDQSKPIPGSGINWSHSLSQGLLWFAPLNEGSGATLYDASFMGPNLATAGSPAWGSGNPGWGLKCPSAAQGAWSATPPSLQIGYPVTIAVGFQITGTPSSGPVLLALEKDAVDSNNIFIGLRTDAALDLVYHWANGASFLSNTISAPLTLNLNSIVSYTVTPTTQTVYLNGALLATNTATALIPTYSSPTMGIGNVQASGARTPAMTFYWAAVWARAFSAPEHASLVANPWQIFLPQSGWLYHPTISATANFSSPSSPLMCS